MGGDFKGASPLGEGVTKAPAGRMENAVEEAGGRGRLPPADFD